MAIQWGGWSGHMRVGIDVWVDPYDTNTPTVNVTADFYVQCEANWSFADNQRLNLGDVFNGQGFDFYNNLGSNEVRYIGHAIIFNQSQRYEGGPGWWMGAQISGHYQGAAPGVRVFYNLPARPANVPTNPNVTVSNVGVSTATVNVGAADGRGGNVDGYETQISLAGGSWSGTSQAWSSGGKDVTGLAANTTYEARSRAHNFVGWSGWDYSGQFKTGSTVAGTPTGLASSNVGQSTADLAWTAPASNGGSAVVDYQIQVATDSAFSQIAATITDTASPNSLTALAPGQAHWVRVRARNGVGYSAWSNTVTFSTLAGTPAILSPANGATVTDAAARVVVSAAGIASGRTITVEVSQDSTFATGVKTLTLSPSAATSNNQYTVQNTSDYLSNALWYARAKVTNTATGYITPWSATVSFTESHQPSASIQTPTGGQTLKYIASPALAWSFTDAAAIDAQTAYRVTVEKNATGELVWDSGKVVSANKSVTFAADVALKNVGLRWRVMVWDRGDTASAWTGYGLFTLSDPPTVTTLFPDPIIPVGNGAPTFKWSVAIPSGGTQQQAVVSVFDTATNALVWTTTLVGTATTATPPVVILRNNVSYYWTVDVKDTTLLTGSTQNSFSTQYAAPATVTYSIDGGDIDELGYIAINWSDANPDDLFAAWKVYRRTLASQWELIATIANQNIRDYHDYMLVAGESYSYSVTQVATRSGSLLESSVGYYINSNGSETAEQRYFDIDLNYYWIINSDQPELSIRLIGVTDDSSTLEYESSEYTIIGRGRHVDYGDRLGYKGTLNFQIRDVVRPSPLRLKIEALRAAQETYHLRTPFGRLFKIALGNLGWAPMAGVGTAEMGDMSIPYSEVN